VELRWATLPDLFANMLQQAFVVKLFLQHASLLLARMTRRTM
jgi:hypothetical protein